MYFSQSFINNHYQLHRLGSDKLTRRKRLPILPGGRFFCPVVYWAGRNAQWSLAAE
jgi:hypothetical protein